MITKFSINISKRCTTAWLNLRTLLSMQFFIYSHVWEQWFDPREDCDACSLWKDVPLHNFLTYMEVFAWMCSHENVLIEARVCIQLVTQFPMLCSTDMFPRCVYYETYSCACSHTKRRLSVHFLTYDVMLMRNFQHITPCLSHNFPQMQSKQSTTSRLFNLWTFLTMQLLTYKDVSVCKLSHMRTCLFATCHKISNVLFRPPCFLALCRLRDVFMCVFAH